MPRVFNLAEYITQSDSTDGTHRHHGSSRNPHRSLHYPSKSFPSHSTLRLDSYGCSSSYSPLFCLGYVAQGSIIRDTFRRTIRESIHLLEVVS